MMKKLVASMMTLAVVLLGLSTNVYAEPGDDLRIIPIIVNGHKVRFPDTEPYINTDGRTMVPVRFVSEKLGADVEWDNETQTVHITHDQKTISMTIGSREVTVNGETIRLDTAAELYEGRTMVPLRFVSEVLDSTVEWDQAAHAVKVTDKEYQKKIDSGEVELDQWGREISKLHPDSYWLRLSDLEGTEFYFRDDEVITNRQYIEENSYWRLDNRINEWAEHIRQYYAAVLNVDYRTIDKEKFTDTLIENMSTSSDDKEMQRREAIGRYVDWVIENKVIVKGYADPENSQVVPDSGLMLMRTYFKFKIISAEDPSRALLDNWFHSEPLELEKGVWYGGYGNVFLGSGLVRDHYMDYAPYYIHNMFRDITCYYEKLQ